MRHKSVLLIGFGLLIFLTLLLLGRLSLFSELSLSIVYALVVIVMLIFLLIDDELSTPHAAVTVLLFLSLAYLIVNLMGQATISTFFLGGLFILAFLVTMVIILVYDWKKFTMFDRMLLAREKKEARGGAPRIPAHTLIEEPPHFRVKNDDEGEWVELEVKKTKATKKTRVKRAKKAEKKK